MIARWRQIGARWLRSLANWSDPPVMRPPGPFVILTVPRDALLRRAVALTREFATWDASGEAKRHQVYAQLQKEFPTRPHREIALAIEAALDGSVVAILD
jgi:hypothetical protein